MSKTSLVIVESPAKAKTIGKYLGGNYKVEASMGHLRDLPKSKMGVDIENGFIPDYQPIKGREETIERLRQDAKASDTVYLATDPDREGEAISWHLKKLLELPDDGAQRITFNEITKDVVRESIKHPRAIDENLVDAQQARRILDRIVGYKLSPLLWEKIRRGLSAGRVQSVAMRIVVDREDEIRAFIPEEYWLLDASLADGKGGAFVVRYYGENGKKRELKSEAEVRDVESRVTGRPFVVTGVKRADKSKSPSPPFITSTLQQEASRKLGMAPRRTMSVAQQLYEGVEINGEAVGLITYMRTDSLRISEEALAAAGDFIKEHYGATYYNGTPRRFKTKSGAQDAHEAIRPSNIALMPESIRKDLTGDQFRLYRLIWSRFAASQMANAIYDSVNVEVTAESCQFRASCQTLKFPGYSAVYEEGRDDDKKEVSPKLPALTEGEELILAKLTAEQKFTQPPLRFTEATLIRIMEEKGIGRPSTYAPTVSTILDREYVVREGKYLRPTPLGEVVTNLMKERFPDIVDLQFTARMEEQLDGVEDGKSDWRQVLAGFYDGFSQELDDAKKALEGEHIKVPDEESDEICDLCGKKMVIKSGRFGRFLACPGYPECTFTKPLVIEMPGKCPKCGGRILKRSSRKGYVFYACENLGKCDFMSWDVPTKDNCEDCGQTLFKKSGRGFNKPFCINPDCPNFLPEDKRGYRKKKPAEQEGTESAEGAETTAEAAEALPKVAEKASSKGRAAKSAAKPAAKKTAKTAKTTKTAKSTKTAKTAKTAKTTKTTKSAKAEKAAKPEKAAKTPRKPRTKKAAESDGSGSDE